MPTSLILYIESHDPLPEVFLGREVQAWFLKAVQEITPTVSRKLHDQDGHKPYTVSDVYHLPEELRGVSPAPLIIRINAYEDSLEELLAGRFIKRLPEEMRLWYRLLRIRGFSCSADESPWAGQLSYQSIAHTAQELEELGLRLEFVSPTGFRSNGKDIAEPLPAHVFRGCMQKWNHYAPAEMRMHPDLPRFIEDCLTARAREDFELQRITFAQGKRGGAVGFTGSVDFAIQQPHASLEWLMDFPSWAAQVRALAMYAFFSGVGHHTTVGLGQTFPRLLHSMNA